MKIEELIEVFHDFVNEESAWNRFLRFAERQGYSEEEITEALDNYLEF